jgi:uncharacterized membrane protein YkvA (DUF1232 family)
MKSFGDWKERVRALEKETLTLYLSLRHPRVPWYAKALALLVVGYALSPIDLIPDFVPVLGYLDDLILVPLGIMLVIRLIPEEVLAECRHQAKGNIKQAKRLATISAAVIVAIWIAAGVIIGWLVIRAVNP